jgi:hypothetical protein
MRETFTPPEVIDQRRRSGKPWLEFPPRGASPAPP